MKYIQAENQEDCLPAKSQEQGKRLGTGQADSGRRGGRNAVLTNLARVTHPQSG